MEQNQNSRKGKHLTRVERMVIERMSRGGIPPRDIAAALERHPRTIQRELKRGTVTHRDSEWREYRTYSSDRGQDLHDYHATARGPGLRLGRNYALAEFIRCRIVEHKESPDVVAFRMRQAGLEEVVCTKTIYNYIDKGVIFGLSNESLWEKRKRAKRRKRGARRLAKRISKGKSIDQRPEGAETREEFGHWEMDLVTGPTRGSNAALLTLVERRHRITIIRKLPDKSQASVLKVLRGLEREHGSRCFRQIFKTITVDNGSEFLDFEALEASSFSKQQRTQIFYAHPYSSWERGSNENGNRMIRRFVAKGRDIARFTKQKIRDIELWINNYPRRILDFMTPHELFTNELKTIS
ncbi:IS30 family transposase [Kiritimatiella glycovorans]|uniref:Transposase, IS30 family n=1 Tax=Kiritimatiella glycovorans TaxID=1307763 RepID=A0A0G3EJ67_9BACT|nr:IS30 family transposase [Kiritimatiella glycovorans]AKJ63420.1 Transposase, IS30 family [Kiritimatiella glycovorans]AKJ63533.1 Transposase, IS30 family [Kiritimatiella glycovorans]AKJ64177.1 Transposase, IS30 family [Kiritimatiella glycovorans]AKJ64229.1 Transposase, IS30 family [Kiritimatiella glycovorans]AKJ64594.1 Transposase, IS30 family [Kiritimatiella glycovorans]